MKAMKWLALAAFGLAAAGPVRAEVDEVKMMSQYGIGYMQLTLMQELKKDPSLASIPVVLISGYSSLGAEAAAMGANGYVSKPVRAEQLLDTVDRCQQVASAR